MIKLHPPRFVFVFVSFFLGGILALGICTSLLTRAGFFFWLLVLFNPLLLSELRHEKRVFMGRSIYIAPLMGIFPELRRRGVVYVRLRVGWLVLHLDGWGDG
jgi:hypothetical protein